MILDENSFLSPSRVRCTVYPLGGVKRSFFVKNVERLQRLREVCLVDISPPSEPHKSMFSPQGFPNGRVVYDISMSKVEDKAKIYLEDLEPWRRTLCVFAITSYDVNRSNAELKRYIGRLREKHPRAILHKVLVFNTPNEMMNKESLLVNKDIIYVPSQKSSVVTTLETIMCDITADFLSELAVLALSYQSSVLKSPNVKEMELLSGVNNNQSISFTGATFKPTISSHSPSASSIALPNSGSSASPVGKTYGANAAVSPSEKLKLRVKARQSKLLAHFYLLSGRITDALREFTDAVNICRSVHDHLWCGSALEGVAICMVILSSLKITFTMPVVISSFISSGSATGAAHLLALPHRNSSGDLSKSGDISPATLLGFLPDLIDSILKLYVKSQALADESVPQLIFCETILRCAKLLTAAHLCGGLNEAAFSAIFHQDVIKPEIINETYTVDVPSKADISTWLNKLLFTDLSTLPVAYQCQIMCGVASVYSSLGMDRKASLMLRKVFTVITPNLIRTDAISGKIQDTGAGKDNILPYLGGKGETGLTDILDSIVRIYSAGKVTAKGYGWIALKKESLNMCIEVCDTVGNLRGTVYFGSLLLSTCADILTASEQQSILNKIKLSVKRSEEFGAVINVQYWDPLILRGIRVLQSNGGGQYPPLKKSKDIISDDTGVDDEESAASGAIIFNPFANRTPGSQFDESKTEGTLTLVENEKIEFAIRLQNPFHFNLNLESLVVSTVGDIELECNKIKVTLLANSVSEVIIVCTPRGTGDLTITGCKVSRIEDIKGPFEFDICNGVVISRQERIKIVGKNASDEITTQNSKLPIPGSPITTTVSFHVIPKQPILLVSNLSLEEKCVTLLIGEKKRFQIGIKNLSEVDVNAMLLIFNDSTVKPLKQVLSNFNDIPLNEIYEIEYFLHNRQALKWLRSVTSPEKDSSVAAKSEKNLEIEILGKRGMVDASIKIEYCNVPVDREQQSRLHIHGESWVRDLVVPINITVHVSIELVSFDILALQPGFKFSSENGSNFLSEFFDSQADNEQALDMSEFCLMTIDLRNCWTCPMEVSLMTQVDNENSGNSGYTITAVINPSCTSRFLIPIKRIHLSSQILSQPIPSLSGRQFVVNGSRNNEENRSMRELFWYREELFKNLHGTWREVPEPRFDIRDSDQDPFTHELVTNVSKYGRTGEVELRGIRLTPDMIKILQVSPVDIIMRIDQDGDNQESVASKNSGQCVVIKDGFQFIKVLTTITNNTDRDLRLILRSIPYIATSEITTGVSVDGKSQDILMRQLNDIDNRILFNGVLQKTIPQILSPGQSFTNQLGALFLSRGEYKWTSVVEEIRPEDEVTDESRTHIQRKPLDIFVK